MMNRREGDSMDDRRVHDRVTKLEDDVSAHQEAMRAHFAEHTQLMSMVTTSVKGVEEAGKKMANSMSEIAEVVKIYNHGRGFVTTMRGIGAFLLWITVMGGALAAIGAAIRYWWRA